MSAPKRFHIKTLLTKALLLISITGYTQLESPYPYDQPIGLAPDQYHQIQSIHAAIVKQIDQEYQRDLEAIVRFNLAQKKSYLTDTDTSGLLLRIHMYYDAMEVHKIDSLLEPWQWYWAAMWRDQKVYKLSIINFEKYKRKQEGNQLCWAACIQMVLNYNGINLGQEQIMQMVLGEYSNREIGLDEIISAINGGHVAFKDSSNRTWLAYIERKDSDINELLSNMLTPFPVGPDMPAVMLEGGRLIRFAFLGINRSHLTIVEGMQYKLRKGQRIPVNITYYDPLLDRDITFGWQSASGIVTDWLSCVAWQFSVVN